MTINKTTADSAVTLALSGRLDTLTAPDFEAAVEEAVSQADHMTLDFAQLQYLSSAGLRVILKAQKVMGTKGSLRVTNVNETVMEIFEITGFTEILTIE
ncbi:MAG: STAS domain-containing protein [Ruminiclostridium sp.]|nr:STAS domain-containing protein [Ruminiclostridium sp.]